MTYLTDRQAAQLFSVSRCSIWRWIKESNFPKPVKFSKGCTRWKLSDIEKWEQEKSEATK